MFDRLNRSFDLVRASAAVLRSDKSLIVFPLVSAVSSLLVTATFFIPVIVYAMSHHLFTGNAGMAAQGGQERDPFSGPGSSAFLFLFYMTQYTVVFFANTALVGAALIRLRGGKPTVADGFNLAKSHMGAILGYALLASTVGMVIRLVSERVGIVGRIVAAFFGLAWNLAPYLVAPILIMENVGPVEAVKRSTGLLKRTWGEQIVGNIGLGTAFGSLAFLTLLVFVPLLIWAVSTGSFAFILIVAILFALALTTLLLIQAALTGIYTAAVYLYAADGFTGGPFNAEHIRSAFRTK